MRSAEKQEQAMIRSQSLLSAAMILLALYGCSSGGVSIPTPAPTPPPAAPPPPPPATYSIGGSISFSAAGTAVLQNNGGDDLTVSNAGTFTFPTKLLTGATYSVSVKSSPTMPLQDCQAVSSAQNPSTGTVAGADVTSVVVQCAPVMFTLGGTVTGLVGSGLVLAYDSNVEMLPIAAAGSFVFTTPALSTSSYVVTVAAQPTAPVQTCSVTNGTGNDPTNDVTNVHITCSAPALACGRENGTVVTHAGNIAASETWAGAGTVHLIPNTIAITAPATVTIQKCAIVKLADNVQINVQGASTGTSAATLLAAGDDPVSGAIFFRSTAATSSPAHRWMGLRGLNANSHIELDNATLSDVAPVTTAAAIVMQGGSTLPDPVLKVNHVVLQNLGGPGVHLGNAAFTADSSNLSISGAAGYPIELSAMALGSVPSGTYVGNLHDELLVVDNANIFDNLDIFDRGVPIRFATDGVHVGGLAPSFVPDLTLTLEAGVVIRFAKFSSGPTMVTFGDLGQSQDKNAAFVVKGTASKPVTLTSGEGVPAPGDWAGIWLATSNRSQIDHLIISYAGGDAAVGPRNCGPPGVRHTAALLVGDGTDLQYIPPGVLITNSTFTDNAGNFAIDSVWQAPTFSPILTATNQFVRSGAVCTQSKNLLPLGCTVGGVDQSGCLVP
jgi:hypothetical protein